MTDLNKLIAAVEAGGWPDRRTEVAAFYSGGSITHCNECAAFARKANAGSLDAALRLHEALLPGWDWEICNDISDKQAEVWPHMKPPRKFCGGWENPNEGNPARAWLLAILRALKAKGDA